MSIKKYTNNAWVDIPYKKYETATDTITSLPKTIIGDGQPISSYAIKGNMQQSGTPTPSNPIYPQEVGDLVTTGEHAGEYKIPILLNGITYPVYLAEPIRKIGDYVDTAPSTGTASRIIKKLVFDGTENWYYTDSAQVARLEVSDYLKNSSNVIYCSHYKGIAPVNGYSGVGNGEIALNSGTNNYLYIRDGSIVGTDYATYFAQQYAAGTPVTVWYVLATAQTESFTAPTLPTSGTAESFDVDTTLKPSEVSLTYHGWHEHSDEKYVGGVVNKFNKDDTTIYNAYLNTAGDWLLSSDSRSVKIPCNPNTQYTLSVSESLAVFRIYSSDNANIIPNGERTTPIARSENISQYTFTTGANTACIVFQGSASVVDTWFNSLMLVEGSTVPSEYHPYYEWVEQS